MENYAGLFEFLIVAAFVLVWALLEWQGRRLDRRKAAERAKDESP
jgi:hypothetical protein